MNRTSGSERILQRLIVLLVALAVPSLLLAQHKPSGGGGGSKPAPQQHSTPSKSTSQSHSAPQSHSTPSRSTTSSHPATSSHTTTTGHSTTPSHTTTPSRSTGTANRGTTTNRPSTATSHTTTPSRGNTTPGRAASTPSRGNAGAGRPAGGARPGAAASRGNVGSHTPPGRSVSLKGGGHANIRPNGSVRSVDRNGMHIEHGIHGGRTVVTERNGARIVTVGHGGGYVQRAYVTRGGHSYYSRTYFYHGAYHVGVYRGYFWGGHAYYGWHPGFYWSPGFYAWGWHPWGAPLYWGVGLWGWGGAPWWGFYAGWWNPYPYYAGPAYWLTDYLVASELQAAYEARQDAQADAMAADAAASADQGDSGGGAAPVATGQVTLTPEVKEAIAAEVKAQLQAQAAQAPGGDASGGGAAPAAPATPAPAADSGQAPPALDPAQRTFVVNSDLTVVSNGQECALSAGDVVTRLTDTPDADQTVNASVSATKKNDCPAGQTVAVKVDDLQEMYNHFQEQLNNGMSEMAKKQGTNGMPKAPDTGTTPSDVPPPQPDTSVAKTLQDQQQQADQTDAQVKQEAAAGGGQ